MNVLVKIYSRLWSVVLVALTLCLVTTPGFAQHQATLVLKNQGRADGVVRYLPASRSYEIKSGPATRQVRADEVDKVILAQDPPQLAPAVKAVNSGNYQAAIPVLVKIVDEYTMLGPDVIASQALALAYLRTNRGKEALAACENVVRINPEALNTGLFASVYWEALLAEDRIPTLRTSLSDAIEKGTRDIAAVALVRRGDLEMKTGNPKAALVDGYLRTVLLFQDVVFIQPEALYKAIKAHEALNEVAFAERWRKRLLAGFPSSEFALKLK